MSYRIRLKLGKGGRLAWVSHLDFSRALGRALRRSGLPLVYSEGFTPRPRYSTCAALPLGVKSRAELVDVHLLAEVSPGEVVSALDPVLPDGMELLAAVALPADEPKLSKALYASSYLLARCGEDYIQRLQRLRDAHRLLLVVDRPSGAVEKDARDTILSARPAGSGGIELVLRVDAGAVGVVDVARAMFGLDVPGALLLDICRVEVYSKPREGERRGERPAGRGAAALLPSLPEEHLTWRRGASGEGEGHRRPRRK